MKTINLLRPVYLATSVVLALVVVVLLIFSLPRDASFNAAPAELDTLSAESRRQSYSTHGGGITFTPQFDEALPEANSVSARTEHVTRKKERVPFKDFKATKTEIQHFYQPAPAALLEDSAEYNQHMQKVFGELGLGDYRRETSAINEAFVHSLTPDELIYYLNIAADGDHAALDKFRQERGFYYPDEPRPFFAPRKKQSRKRYEPSAKTESPRVNATASPFDDAPIVESNDIKQSNSYEAPSAATDIAPNPHAQQRLEAITRPLEPFEGVLRDEERNPETTSPRLETDLSNRKTPQNIEDLPHTDPEPPTQRERHRKNQRSRHAPYGDNSREH